MFNVPRCHNYICILNRNKYWIFLGIISIDGKLGKNGCTSYNLGLTMSTHFQPLDRGITLEKMYRIY